MMDDKLNSLERAILQWIKEHYQNDTLSAQIDAASLAGREWTGAGFYVDLAIPNHIPALDAEELGGWPITGPALESDDIDEGGGSILWGDDGYISTIEMFGYGDYFKEEIRDFELHAEGKSL